MIEVTTFELSARMTNGLMMILSSGMANKLHMYHKCTKHFKGEAKVASHLNLISPCSGKHQ